MRVDPLQGTFEPEQTVCTAARGDYFDGYVGTAEYAELMEPVEGDSLDEKEKNLIWQLLDRGHYGPFEHATMTFAVEGLSRSCMAQLTRHRFISFDVQSMRYVSFEADDPTTLAEVPKSLTDADHFAREVGAVDVDDDVREQLHEEYLDLVEHAMEFYTNATEAGVPKEDARFGLPIGTKVNLTMTMNARTLLHIVNMRGKGDAQWEIRELAEIIEDVGRYWIPNAMEWFDAKGPLRESP